MITLQAITANGVPIAACPAAKLTKLSQTLLLSLPVDCCCCRCLIELILILELNLGLMRLL